jgi:hypothetical protein
LVISLERKNKYRNKKNCILWKKYRQKNKIKNQTFCPIVSIHVMLALFMQDGEA